MGLDGVELMMRVEEQFGIAIPDGDAEKLLTPALLIDYIYTNIQEPQLTDPAGRGTHRGFYRLRRVLMQQSGLKRNDISPDTPLALLFPGRRLLYREWLNLRDALECRSWPWLMPSRRVSWLSLLAGICGEIMLWRMLDEHPVGLRVGLMLATGMVGFAVWLLVMDQLIRADVFPGHLPHRTQSVGNLARFSTIGNKPTWTREEVAVAVKRIVIELLHISEAKYAEDKQFVRDLGAG